MTQDEQIETAIRAGAMVVVSDHDHANVEAVRFIPTELADYTAAVEAKERERCAEWVSRNLMPAGEMADEIRAWK